MRKALAVALSICLVYAPVLGYAATPAPGGPAAALAQEQDQGGFQPYSPEQLDNLLAPIALYPDPLLAQVLPAATFPDQIDQAAQYVAANGQNGVDDQPWDVSVKAVAHYPSVLNMMDQKLDWTTAVGQAYVYQSTDVTASIQRLRHMAYSQRNLVTTPQQDVIVEGGYIQIVPAQPRYIYVPVYNPDVIYVRPAGFAFGVAAISFGAGFFIGAWLNRDWDWGGRGIYYTGWQGGGWVARSRGFVQINNRTYVNNVYRNVTINNTVINRNVNYNNIRTYNNVHNNISYNNRVTNNNFNRNGRGNAAQPMRRPGQDQPQPQNRGAYQPNRGNMNRNAPSRGQYQPQPQNRGAYQPNRGNLNRNAPSRGQYQPQPQNRGAYQPNRGNMNRNAPSRGQYQPQPQNRGAYQPNRGNMNRNAAPRGQAPRPQGRPARPASNQRNSDKGTKGGKNQGKGRHPGT